MKGEENRIFDHIERDDLVSLAKDLVNIPSPTGEEGKAAEFVLDWLSDAGFKTVKQEVEPDRYNAVGVLPGTDVSAGSSLLFNGHLDTGHLKNDSENYLIYGEEAPEPQARQEEGLLYGAGMLNDKGPLAATLVAAKAIRDADIQLNGDLIVSAVPGEIGTAPVEEFQSRHYRGHGIGTRHLVTHGFVTDYAVVAENSGWGIGWGLPGVLYLKITVPGNPEYISDIDSSSRNENHAIYRAMTVIDKLTSWGDEYTRNNTYEYEQGVITPKVNVGAVRGGHPAKPNFQTGIVQIYLDIRVPPHRALRNVRDEVQNVVTGIDTRAEIETYRAQRGYAPTREGNESLDFLVETVERSYRSVFGEDPPELPPEHNNRWHDVNILAENDIPAVKIAPGHAASMEGTGVVSVEDLTNAAKIYAATALLVCQ